MLTRSLTEAEFKATFGAKMLNVTEKATDVLDIWPYVHSVPPADLQGHSLRDGLIECVYRTDDGLFDHVLVMTNTRDVYLAVVVDLRRDRIHGHRLLNLKTEYGLA